MYKRDGIYAVIAGLLFITLLIFPVNATSHYSYEHAEEMMVSGRIEWRDYGPDAFNDAIAQNKPIFLLLTAPSWCYWCHVYTSDDYIYHSDIYPVINEKFIPIYVDADKRQDLTRKYLEGGWPSTTIMAPGGERLFGYSGPRPVQNMLANLNQAVQYVESAGFSNKVSYSYKKEMPVTPTDDQLTNFVNSYASYMLQAYDSAYGGFGTGQKFPQGRSLDFSLEIYESTKNEQFLTLVENTLQNQYTKISDIETNYNLFDPVEGGFHRYGTQRDWTPPHYEKMLYDNAKLLRAYFHLQQITPNESVVNEVVGKTHSYMKTHWYDHLNGGFYGNTDVHGEDAYYGKNPRPFDKPRVEKTKYSDWNTEAILTYLYLWQQAGNEEYRDMAKKSLDFFSQNMISEYGAYHYYKEDGSKGVRGSLLDNSYLLLAFTEGYEILGDDEYLAAARRIANYSLNNLYDWNSGGFFERNSPDRQFYAPGENIDFSKPVEENGIMAYAMLKLYKNTGDARYLDVGIKTLGVKLGEAGGLDSGYYTAKASQLILQSGLMQDYNARISEIEQAEQDNLKAFWVNDIVKAQSPDQAAGFAVSDEGLDKLEGPIILLLLVAFFAGLISFVSPCTLPILPAYIAYTFRSSEKNVKGMTLLFFLGLAVIFTLLGMSATFVGQFLRSNLTVFSQVAGAIIIFAGLYILFGRGFSGLKIRQNRPTTYAGAFVFGTILGLSWTPCIGPILVAILLLASTSGSVLTGGLLMFTYAIGLALPLLLFSTYLSKADRNGRLWSIIKGKELQFSIGKKAIKMHTTSLISGLLFIVLGYLIFSGALYALNQYVGSSSFQGWIFSIEERMLNILQS